MEYDVDAANLSNMSTNWTLIFQTHSQSPGEAHAAAIRLMQRYAGAVHRYLLKAINDPDAADELAQDFALRFLRGEFRHCDPQNGRFRDFVKRALQNLINDNYRRKRATVSLDDRGPQPAAADAGIADFEEQFAESWRKDLLERAWQSVEELEKNTGQPYHTVLRTKVSQPDLTSDKLADQLSATLRKSYTARVARQVLQRSRQKFVEYLLTEVLASLDNPTRDDLEQELRELNLLRYVSPFLRRRHASFPDGPTAAQPTQTSATGTTSCEGPEQGAGLTPAPEWPSPSIGRADGSQATEPILLDQIIAAKREPGRLDNVAEVVAEAFLALESSPYDPVVARSKIEAAIQLIDLKLDMMDAPAALTAARQRLQELLARVEGSVSLSATLDQLLVEDTAIRDVTQADAKTTSALRQPEAVPSQLATIRRHTDVSFPAEVQAAKVYNLRLQLVPATIVLPSGETCERPKPHSHDATLDLLVPPLPPPDALPVPIKLTVSVAAENFEIEGPARAEIAVPLEGKSPAVQFGLRGLEIGPGRIMIDFAQDGRPAGSVDLTPVIVGSGAAFRPFAGLAPTSLDLSLDLETGTARASPDVVLKVFEHRLSGHPGRLHFVLSSNHPALADLPVLDGDLGTLDLRTDVADWVSEQLRVVGTLAGNAEASADEGARILASVGFNLFEHLLPPAVQEMSWTLRERGVKTIMVLSDEPHIPWELVKPFRADPVTGAILSEDSFWGESYALAHWLRGRPPMSRLTVARVVGIAAAFSEFIPGSIFRPGRPPTELRATSIRDMVRIDATSTDSDVVPETGDNDSGHTVSDTHTEHAGVNLEVGAQDPAITHGDCQRSPESAAVFDEELGVLRAFEALGARVERLPALRQALRQAFEEGSFDLLHLVSHGTFGGPDAADATAVYLDDGVFTAAELSPRMAAALRRSAPLVIFNTCHCGRTGFSITRLGSWGAHLVRLGCGAFIGALWPVSDRAALAFARAFYQQLTNERPLGEAVRQARLRSARAVPRRPDLVGLLLFCRSHGSARARAP